MPLRRAKRARLSDLTRRASRSKLATFHPEKWQIDYASILNLTPTDQPQRVALLASELPSRWRDAYLAVAARPTNVLRMDDEGFAYLFDWYSQSFTEATSAADLTNEDRLVAAFGFSLAPSVKRNSARQRGWIGPTGAHLGPDRDKGHFVPHSLGGGLEINLFVQRRDLNRGWSIAGKIYRAMESYCLEHPGTFFFQPAVLLRRNCAACNVRTGPPEGQWSTLDRAIRKLGRPRCSHFD